MRPIPFRGLLSVIVAFAAHDSLAAQNQAAATVSFEVRPINEIALSGSPAPLVINAAVAGAEPMSVTDQSTTWAVTTNELARKVTAATGALPTGVSLEIAMAAPAGASTLGFVTLATTAQDIVTDIATAQASALQVTYRLSATVQAGIVAPASATITFTITSGI